MLRTGLVWPVSQIITKWALQQPWTVKRGTALATVIDVQSTSLRERVHLCHIFRLRIPLVVLTTKYLIGDGP